MKTNLYIYKSLLKIYKLKILREPFFKQNIWARIFIGIIFLVSLFNVALLGYYFIQILEDIKISNPIEFIVSKLLIYLIVLLGIKIIFSKPELKETNKFILLPYPRKIFLEIAILQSLFSFSTLIVLSFLISFSFSSIYQHYPLSYYLGWLIKVFLLVLILELIRIVVLFSKHFFVAKIISISFISILILVDRFFNPNILEASSNLIFSFIFNEVQIVLILSLIVIDSFLYKFALNNMLKYIRNEYFYPKRIFFPLNWIKINKKKKLFRKYIDLEIKQIFRNKGTKIFVVNTFFLFLLGVIANIFILKQNTISPVLFFTCFFSLGVNFTLTYGINTFNWQRDYLSVIFVHNFDLSSFVKAKLLMFIMIDILFFGITMPLFFYLSKELSLYYMILFLYYLPLSSFFVLYLANINITNLNLNMYNNTRFSVSKLVLVFLAFYPLFISIIVFTSALIQNMYIFFFFLLVGLPGIINLLFYEKWHQIIYKNFLKNKYLLLNKTEL